VAADALLVEIPTTAAAASSPDLDPSVGEGDLQVDLDTTVGEDARSLDPNVDRILLEEIAVTYEVHQQREILLSTGTRVLGYSEKPVTQKN
jgi:hypothetical protein